LFIITSPPCNSSSLRPRLVVRSSCATRALNSTYVRARWRKLRVPGESAEAYARRAAREKALRVGLSSPPSSLVLAADTVVEIGSEILGKPAGPEDARRMLGLLSGSTHRLITAVCVVRPPQRVEALKSEATWVTFRNLSADEIRAYVATGEPLDKAGAYAIQRLASRFVARLEGCYFNVVGLPVALVCELLRPFRGG
jgi:nucleoside triphosphate pyrophosphatase